jgi:uncharacterized protein (TIGR03435 family)
MTRLASLSLLAIAPAFAQQPKFDVADVHVSSTAYWFAQTTSGFAHDAILRDGRYIYRDATILELIQAAYGVTEDAIAGGPSWVKSDFFDVVAEAPEGTTLATANLMLQPLLEERLGLVIRKETRPMPRYVLSVGKGGSKLKRASGTADSGCRQQLAGGGGGGQDDSASIPNLKLSCRNLTSQQIADNLHEMEGDYTTTYVGHEIVDSTALEGAWDFDLEFTPSPLLPEKGRDGITIFDALNKQLGLKLELQDVPVMSLFVARVNRKPTVNPPEAAALAVAAPRFEAAAIKPPDPTQPIIVGLRYPGGSQLRIAGTFRALMALAFQIQPNAANDELIGLPKSADSQIWDITAKLPSAGEGAPGSFRGQAHAPPLSVTLEMLRGLLVDRFELKIHRENREATVYALTLGDGKPKLTKADESERSDCLPDPNARKPLPNLGTMVNCKNITMAEFARNLEQAGLFDHPIVDATGLDGGWSFLLGFSQPRWTQVPNADQPAGAIVAASDPDEYVSAYEAVQKELGLKLVKQKRSIPVIVVDHVVENPIQ